MSKTKILLIEEDLEREYLTDSLFHLEREMDIEQEYEDWVKEQRSVKTRKKATILTGIRNKNSKFTYGKYREATIIVPRIIKILQYRRRSNKNSI